MIIYSLSDSKFVSKIDNPSLYRDDMSKSKGLLEAMRYFGGAVHILATDGQFGLRGLTLSTCFSLSEDPAILGFCLKQYNDKNEVYIKNKHFSINSLAANNEDLSDIFGGINQLDHSKRFQYGEWIRTDSGVPILKNCLMSFECEFAAIYEHINHQIFIAKVVDIYCGSAPNALVYLQQKYHKIDL